MEIIWNFFEMGHGKGEHDGAGACIKRALRRHQLNHESERFRDAKDVVEWCKSHMSVDSSSSETEQSQSRRVRRFFYFLRRNMPMYFLTFRCKIDFTRYKK